MNFEYSFSSNKPLDFTWSEGNDTYEISVSQSFILNAFAFDYNDSQSFFNISVGSTFINFTNDNSIADHLYLGDRNYYTDLGIISAPAGDLQESVKSNPDISIRFTILEFWVTLDTMIVTIENNVETIELVYQADTGFLLMGHVSNNNFDFDFELTKINGGDSYFDDFALSNDGGIISSTSSSGPSFSQSSFGIVIIVLSVLFLFVAYRYQGSSSGSSFPSRRLNWNPSNSQNTTTTGKSIDGDLTSKNSTVISKDKVYIDELGRSVKICCYQTARLGDGYCMCGRAIPDDLESLFS